MSLVTFEIFTKKKKSPSKMYIQAYLPRAMLLGVVSFVGTGLDSRAASVRGVLLGLKAGSKVML